MNGDNPFRDAGISRRRFVKLSAATGGVLALPSQATADVSSAKFTDEYQYVLNHTPEDHEVSTLVEFSDTSGFAALESLGVEVAETTTGNASAYAYAPMTTEQAQLVVDVPTAEELSYTQGSNPFWRADLYPLGVFPQPFRSADFIDYEQMIDGLDRLESEYPDRLNFFSLNDEHLESSGRSPGHVNRITDEIDPKDVYVAELTNDVDDQEAFEEKQKIMIVCGMHGLERAGVESGCRFIEDVLNDRPVTNQGDRDPIRTLLEDAVILFCFPNPDGWVARSPQYDSGWQLTGRGRDDVRVPAGPQYERGNSMVFDTNRQYPTPGWIDPAHHPSEPRGEKGVDGTTPPDVARSVPDSMSMVEHFRKYENLTHGADLHGMLQNKDFILGMINQNQYSQDEFHDLYEMNRVLEEVLEEELDTWEGVADAQKALTDDFNPEVIGFPVLPETAFDYSTIWDTLGYTITGGLIGWMAAPEEFGGIDVTTMGMEMAFSHMVGSNVYEPTLVDMQVRGYHESIYAITEYALRDVSSEVVADPDLDVDDIDEDTEGESVGYVYSESLIRRSDDLPFIDDGEVVEQEGDREFLVEDEEVALSLAAGGTNATTFAVPEDTHTLSIHSHTDELLYDATLRDPSGEVVRETNVAERNAEAHHHLESFVVTGPDPGQWTLEATSLMDRGGDAEFEVTTMQAAVPEYSEEPAEGAPNPREVLGFRQTEYQVEPFVFFEEFDEDNLTIDVRPIHVDDVTDASDVDGFDHLVVIHDDRIDDAAYVDAIDAYVENGGNLVLTDTGAHLLGALDSVDAIAPEDVVTEGGFEVAHLGEKDPEHPLLHSTRPVQRLLWKVAPLGYAYGDDSPMTLVDPEAFESAGGTVAGTTDGRVTGGSIFTTDEEWQGVHVLGGLLPPASQQNLHPFGLVHHAVSFFGHTLLTNALNLEQRRIVDGEEVGVFGDAGQSPAPGDGGDPEISAEGDRELDSSIVAGRQATRVDVTVESVSAEARVYDRIPEGWRLLERHSDAAVADEETGRIRLFERESYDDAPEEADTVGSEETPATFTYFVESPEGLDESGPSTFGPGEARAVEGEGTDEFAGEDDAFVLGVDL